MSFSRFGPPIVAAIGLLLAIAGALNPSEEGAAPGSPAVRIAVALPDWLVMATVAALAAASLILLAMIAPRPRPRRKKGEEPHELYYEPRKAPLTVVVLLLLLALTPPAILAASIVWLDRNEVFVHRPSGGALGASGASRNPQGRLQPEDNRPRRSASPFTADILGALALLAGFGCLGVMLWLRFGDRLLRQPFEDEPSRARLATAVEESLDDLRREADARTAIIKCYRRFENVLAAAQLARPPWQTPVEFMRAALHRLPLPATPVANLTRLFEIARFSHHAVGPAEREGAWQSLLEVREALPRKKEEPDAAAA